MILIISKIKVAEYEFVLSVLKIPEYLILASSF